MSVSASDFTAWLRRPAAKRVVLAEIDYAYESAGAPATGTIRLSDRGFATKPSDTPASTIYRSRIKSVPRLRRGLDRGNLSGRSSISVSDLVLHNRTGALDDLEGVILDGQEVRFYVGDKTWALADFRLAFVAVAERVASNDSELTVKLRDKRLLLDREIIGSQVGGTGAEADQYLDSVYGSAFNLEARIYDAASAIWAVLSNFGASSIAYDVRDNGVSLQKTTLTVATFGTPTITVNAGTDTFAFTAHGLAVDDVVWFKGYDFAGNYSNFAPFAGLTSGTQYWVKTVPDADHFTLSATKGGATLDVTSATYVTSGALSDVALVRRWKDTLATNGRIELSGSAVGRVTVDVGNSTANPFAMMLSLIQADGTLAASEIDTAAFTAADAALGAKIGAAYHNYTVKGRDNLLAVLESIAASAFGWIGVSRDGKITVGVVDVSGIEGATPTRTITTASLAGGGRIAIENAPVDIGRATVLYNRNHTVQSDGLGDVGDENRRRYALEWLGVQRSAAASGTTYAGDPFLYHRTMIEGEQAPLGELSDYVFGLAGLVLAFPDFAGELVADAAPHRQFLTAPCRLDFWDVEIGEIASVTYPRHGLALGANALVYGITLDLSAGRVDLELVRRRVPITTQGAYS